MFSVIKFIYKTSKSNGIKGWAAVANTGKILPCLNVLRQADCVSVVCFGVYSALFFFSFFFKENILSLRYGLEKSVVCVFQLIAQEFSKQPKINVAQGVPGKHALPFTHVHGIQMSA